MTIATVLLAALLAIPTTAFAPNPTEARRPILGPLRAADSDSDSNSPLDAILFDCDGVLADTERDGHRLAFNMAFEENGIEEEWSEERYGTLLEVGGGKERMTAHWNEVGWPAQIPESDRASKVLDLHLQKTDIFMQLIDDGKIPLRPGILRLVDDAIASNIRLAVCSTSNEKAVSNLVSTLMGERRARKFNVYAGDMVRKKKPAPDVYLMAVEEMGLDKARCVIVEDSHIGVGAAVAAGIACVVTKSSYTAQEDFTGAKMIVDELGEHGVDGVTLDTLSGLLDNHDEIAPQLSGRGIGVPMEDHVERGGASWTGARFGDDNINRPRTYTASETYKASGPRGIGVGMEKHVEKGGSSWTGARFGDDAATANARASGPRGIGVGMEKHVEKGGSSWTGARFGDDAATANARASGPRGIGVGMEKHVEKGGSSWTGARFGDDAATVNARGYTPSETYQASSTRRGIGVEMDRHVESGGASWTGARLGDETPAAASPAYRASSNKRGIGVGMERHVESGGASWTGARLGEETPAGEASRGYAPSETREFQSEGKGSGADWDAMAHTEVLPEGGDGSKWSGARFGDENVRRNGPTPSPWHE